MGRKLKTDNVDALTAKRRERQRQNQARCMENKRKRVAQLENDLKQMTTTVEGNLSKYDKLHKECQVLISTLHKQNLSKSDRDRLVQVQAGMGNTYRAVGQCKEKLQPTTSNTPTPPNVRQKCKRDRDQAVPRMHT